MIEFEFTPEGSKKIDLYTKQNGLDSIDTFEVRFVKSTYKHPGILVLILEPILHIKDNYELRVNPSCKVCNGKAYIRYWFAQDESRVHPCHVCFPETAEKSKSDREWFDKL